MVRRFLSQGSLIGGLLRSWVIVLGLGLWVWGGDALAQDRNSSDSKGKLPTTEIVIRTAAGNQYEFRLELAATRWARVRGLMFRKSLPSNSGMMFTYNVPRPVGIWMKNTYVPLDILFLNAEGKIIKLTQRAVPLSEEVHRPRSPVVAVVELLGGTAERLNIRQGDYVVHEFFENQPVGSN